MASKQGVFATQAEHYLENGFALLQLGEVGKASELLWGSVAEALKAVAAQKGHELRHHRELRQYARNLARELGDADIWQAYVNAEHLHSDFYEVELALEDVMAIAEEVKEVVKRLLDLLEEPLAVDQ